MRAAAAALTLAFAAVAGGCLSTPPPGVVDGGGDDDDDDDDDDVRDGGGDATDASDATVPPLDGGVVAGGPCSPGISFTGAPLPGNGVGIRQVLVADVNGDAQDDLLLTNADGGPASWGIYILLGPQPDASSLQYHVFVPTEVSPDGVAVRDVIRDTPGELACPELLVLGADQGNEGHLEVHHHVDDDPDMYALAIDKALLFTPLHDGPVIVELANLLGDGADDLVVADQVSMYVYYTGGDVAANLETAAAIQLGPTGSATPGIWNATNAVFPVPRPGDAQRDDLVVVEGFSATWLHYDGVGEYTQGARVENGSAFVSRSLARVDLDGAPPDDIVSSGGDKLGAYLLADTGASLELTQASWASSLIDLVDGYTDGFVVADLGGSGLPDVALVDGPQGAGTSQVYYLESLRVTDGALEPTTTPAILDLASTGIVAHRIVRSRFDGAAAPRLLLVDADGAAICAERNPAAAVLRLCD